MVSLEEVTNQDLTRIILRYLDFEYWDMLDFTVIIDRKEIIEDRNIVRFDCYFMDLYLDTRDLSFVDVNPKI